MDIRASGQLVLLGRLMEVLKMIKVLIKIVCAVIIVGLIASVGLAAFAFIYDLDVIAYHCSLTTAHLLLMTLLITQMVDLDTIDEQMKNKNPNGGNK